MRPSGKAISIHSYRLHHRSRRGRCNRITVSVEKLANIAELSAISAKNLPFGILTILRQSEFRYSGTRSTSEQKLFRYHRSDARISTPSLSSCLSASRRLTEESSANRWTQVLDALSGQPNLQTRRTPTQRHAFAAPSTSSGMVPMGILGVALLEQSWPQTPSCLPNTYGDLYLVIRMTVSLLLPLEALAIHELTHCGTLLESIHELHLALFKETLRRQGYNIKGTKHWIPFAKFTLLTTTLTTRIPFILNSLKCTLILFLFKLQMQ